MKTKCYKLILASTIFVIALFANAQAQTPFPCGSDQVWQKQVAEHPELLTMQTTYAADLDSIVANMKLDKTSYPILYIPVVFHVIHLNGSEDISDAQIYNVMRIINRDWAKLNPDINKIIGNSPFHGLAANMQIQFRLAQKDPDGRCTNGIERIYSHKTIYADESSKLHQWPREMYLNIWTVQSLGQPGATAAAYALFPSSTTFYPQGDGVISLSNYVGSIGTSSAFNSRTITHELAHCFAIEHVWGGTNNPWVACGDDGVDDTPITRGHYSSCNDSAYCQVSWAKKIVYDFNGLHLTTGNMDPTGPHSDTASASGNFMAMGVAPTPSEAGRFSFAGWGTGAPDGATGYFSLTGSQDIGKYYEVTLATTPGRSMFVDSVTFNVNRSADGVRTYAVRSSADGYTSNLNAVISPNDTTNLIVKPNNTFFYKKDTTIARNGSRVNIGGALVTSASPLTFRFYGWNAESAAGSFSIDDVRFFVTNPAHDSITYNFSNLYPPTAAAGTTTDPTAVQVDTAVNVGTFTANGVGTTPLESTRFTYDNWSTGTTLDNTQYYEFTLGPRYGMSQILNNITFNVQRNMTGARSFAVRSSLDGYAANLPASVSPASPYLSVVPTNEFYFTLDTNVAVDGAKITLAMNTDSIRIHPCTFRIYAWNAEDAAGTFSVDNVSVSDWAGLIENYQNYMDYSYCGPNGQIMFTNGQKDRVRAAATSTTAYRNNLWRGTNLVATGTDSAYFFGSHLCVPKPDFYADKINICIGGTVTFHTNITSITDSTAYTKTWRFYGAGVGGATTTVGPLNVTAANSATQTTTQTATYNTAGDWPVTLVVSNAAGTDSIVKTTYIHVSPPWSQYSGLALENFENTSSYYWNWEVNNFDNNAHTWELTNTAGYSGNHSMRMNGYGNYVQDVDNFITPKFNLSFISGGQVTFRVAASSRALVSSDLQYENLKVYSSSDCGATWLLKLTLSGAGSGANNLINNANSSSIFVPTSSSQWALKSFPISASLAHDNVRFKFEYTTGDASNMIYIDDINITGSLGIDENAVYGASLNIFPNPTNESATIAYHLDKRANVKIELYDIVGKKVKDIASKNEAEGDYTYQISKDDDNLSSGIYIVKFIVDGNQISKKLIITQ
jgi:hypothetical protein